MTAKDQIILILLLFSFVLFSSALITKMRGGLFIIDYKDLNDQNPNREDEKRKGLMYANFIFKWLKYFVGVLLLFLSNKIFGVTGALIILFSFILDKKSR